MYSVQRVTLHNIYIGLPSVFEMWFISCSYMMLLE